MTYQFHFVTDPTIEFHSMTERNLILCSIKSHFMNHQSHFMLHQSHFMSEPTKNPDPTTNGPPLAE